MGEEQVWKEGEVIVLGEEEEMQTMRWVGLGTKKGGKGAKLS